MSSVIISIDAELGWGFHDMEEPPQKRIEYARHGWQQLHELCETYGISATWAVVGHLLLDDCDGYHHSHPTPSDWFARERTEWKLRRDLRFGGELIEALQTSDLDHDIGSHTFSHVVFDDPRLDETVIEAEIEAAKNAAKPYDIEYDSFVFPRNAVGYRGVLADTGFRVYRGREPQTRRHQRQWNKIAATVNPSQVPLVEPTIDEYGLVNVPPSLFLYGFQGLARVVCETLWTDPIVRQVTGAIDKALTSGGIVHIWLHPNDLVTERDINRIEKIFAYIDSKRDSGLTVETLADVADRVLQTEQHHSKSDSHSPIEAGPQH